MTEGAPLTTEKYPFGRDERSGADRCWIYRDGYHYAQVTFDKPDARLYPTAVEYMRVMPWKEVEKVAASEGIEADRYVSVLHARSEMQRREITRLHGLLKSPIRTALELIRDDQIPQGMSPALFAERVLSGDSHG